MPPRRPWAWSRSSSRPRQCSRPRSSSSGWRLPPASSCASSATCISSASRRYWSCALSHLRDPARSIEGSVAGAAVAKDVALVGAPQARELALVDAPGPATDTATDALDAMGRRWELGRARDACHREGLLSVRRTRSALESETLGQGFRWIPSACSVAKGKVVDFRTPVP